MDGLKGAAKYYEYEAREWFLSIIPSWESHKIRMADLANKGIEPVEQNLEYDVAVPGTLEVHAAIELLENEVCGYRVEP